MRTLLLASAIAAISLVGTGCDGSAAAGPKAAAGSAASATCSMVATWTGTYSCPGPLSGKHYNWIMNADGTAAGSIEGLGPINQTWALKDGVLTINEKDQCAGEGKYKVKWAADCSTMTLSKVSDACAPRGACVDKLTSKRSK